MSATEGTPAAGAEDPALVELREAYAGGDLVVFVGAGISASAGLPNWKRLVEILCEHAMARRADPAALQEILDLVASRQLIDALSALKVVLGGDEFCSIIERHLDDSEKDIPEAARVIADLSPGLRAILTTNLDHLLERALSGRWPALARATPDIARRRGYILKLHGTLLDRTTWVFTREEYDRAMYADPVLKTTFSALFHACPLLFVGYGLSDADFDVLLGQVRALTGDQSLRHYALVPREAATPHRRKLLEDSGLRLIPYDNPDGRHGRLLEILRSLAVPLERKLAARPVEGTSAEGPRPTPSSATADSERAAVPPPTKEETAGRRSPRRWPLIAAAAAALIAVAGGGTWAWRGYQQTVRAEEAARLKAEAEGRSRVLVREARERLAEDPEQALRKLAEAWAQAPVPEVEEALLEWTVQRGRRVLRPKAPPAVAAFSPDGRHVATAGTGKVTLWEAEGPRSTDLFMADGNFAALGVAFSPGGKHLSVIATNGSVLLWEVPSGKALGKLELRPSRVPSVAYSPDGKRLIAADGEKAWVWELGAGQPVAVEPPPRSGKPIALSPDGRRALLVAPEGTSLVWEMGGGKPPVALKDARRAPTLGVFSPDGQRLLTSGPEGGPQVWDLASSGPPLGLEGPPASLKHAAFSPDGKQVLAAGEEVAGLWDMARGHRLFGLKGHAASITAVAFSADGQQVLTASEDRTVRVWDAGTGHQLLGLAHGAPVRHAAFSADGRRVVTSSAAVARIWDTGAVVPLEVLEGHRGYVPWARFTPDGKRVVTQGEDAVRVWEPGSGKPPKVLGAGSAGIFLEAALGPGGGLVALSSSRTSTWIWDVASEQAKLELPSGALAVSGLAYSGDGKRVAGGTVGGDVWLWDAATGEGKRLSPAHEGLVSSAVFAPDGNFFATVSVDKLVRLWMVAGGAGPVTLRGHAAEPTSVAFSSDGRRVLTGSWDGTARLWDAASGSEERVLRHGPGYVAASFGPGDQRIATAGRDRIVRLWDAASGKEQAKLEGHGDGISTVVFSSDGKYLLTASNDRTARLWDAATGRFIEALRGARQELLVAVFSPDGRRILTAGSDGAARVYACGPCASMAERLEVSLAGIGVACEERRTYLPALSCPAAPPP